MRRSRQLESPSRLENFVEGRTKNHQYQIAQNKPRISCRWNEADPRIKKVADEPEANHPNHYNQESSRHARLPFGDVRSSSHFLLFAVCIMKNTLSI